jgi:regulator of sigma E protease
MQHFFHTALLFALVLGIMVLIHELGHFAVAKWCRVRVETFSIGFGPRLFGMRFGDTDYRLSLLPLGGYVKMAGDVPGEAPSGDPAEFNAHPRWQRMLIALAGPVANFILSFFLLFAVGLYHHEVDEYLDGPAVVDYVPVNSPAAKIGLVTGDTITAFNTQHAPRWGDIFNECALNDGRDVPLTFMHNGTAHNGTLRCSLDTRKDGPFAAALASMGIIPRLQPDPLGVYAVADNTPAQRAGLKAGDKILRVDDFAPHSADPGLVSYLRDHNGAPVTITVLRGTETIAMTATPEKLPSANGELGYKLGFSNRPAPTRVEKLSPPAAARQSLEDNADDSKLILRVLKGMFTRHVSVKNLSGPVGIAQQIDLAEQSGHWTLLRLMSSISLNLGIFNLLPIPILDGGMILFLLIEAAMRRDLNQQIKERVYQAAFVCLILFAAFVFYNDIARMH